MQRAQNKKGKISRYRQERVNAQRALLAVDDLVLAIIDALEASGKLDDTVICFLSDHGFLFGEHGLIKKHWPYEEAIRIPLLIRYPGLVGNRQENRVVSNVDLAATFAEIAGVTPGAQHDGRSLLPMIRNPTTFWDEAALLEKHPDARGDFSFFGVRVAGWTYVEYSNGEKELYDLTADPYQLSNRANQPAYQAKQAQLKARLEALLDSDPRPTATPSATPSKTATHTPTPTDTPTVMPTDTPTVVPTETPTVVPTETPTLMPTDTPTVVPTETPTPIP